MRLHGSDRTPAPRSYRQRRRVLTGPSGVTFRHGAQRRDDGRLHGVGPTAAPRELTAHALGDGIVDDQPLSLTAGTAGSDIVAIPYLSATYGEVTASMAGGHFALWLPGTELRDASSA